MDRQQVRARLTPEALQAWDRVRLDNGLTWTSMLEALGQDLAAGRWKIAPRTIRLAHQIDMERRSR